MAVHFGYSAHNHQRDGLHLHPVLQRQSGQRGTVLSIQYGNWRRYGPVHDLHHIEHAADQNWLYVPWVVNEPSRNERIVPARRHHLDQRQHDLVRRLEGHHLHDLLQCERRLWRSFFPDQDLWRSTDAVQHRTDPNRLHVLGVVYFVLGNIGNVLHRVCPYNEQ